MKTIYWLPIAAGLLVLTANITQAACPSWPTSERFTINGAEVTDKRTGLVWARCSVGQSWSGFTCTGSANTMSHESALQYAATQSGWRLPNVKELYSLVNEGCSNRTIDSIAFPNTYTDYWTSSPYVGNSYGAWGVSFVYGNVSALNRSLNLAVRLVRASQ